MKKMIITIEKVNDKHYVIRDSAGIKLMDATPDDNTFYMFFDVRYQQIEASDPEEINEVESKALNLQRVVFSETDNLKIIGTFCEKCREVVCKCENASEAEVCKCLLCYPIITARGYVAKKCINCGIEHLHT